MLDMRRTIPENKKTEYESSDNSYVILVKPIIVPNYAWDHETLIELADKNHLKTIKKARREYEEGKVLTEDELLEKLK